MLKVSEMHPNQYVIETNSWSVLQSYNTLVVAVSKDTGLIYLDKTAYNYSKTTSKYRNKFLNMSNYEFKAKLENGYFILEELQDLFHNI